MSAVSRNIDPGDLTPVELALGVALRVFVSGGATGSKELTVCSATFAIGAELPCHTHPTSEIIYAFSGYATAIVEERAYQLRPGDLLHVPAGVRHLVRNPSGSDACLYTFFPTPSPERSPAPPPAELQYLLTTPAQGPETMIRSGDSWNASTDWPIRFRKVARREVIAVSGPELASLSLCGSGTKDERGPGSVLFNPNSDTGLGASPLA